MPTYTFRKTDGELVYQRLTFAEYDELKAGTSKLLDPEGQELVLVFDASGVGFVMKDGVSGGWASKALKENKHRIGRAENMKRREKDHVFKSRLVPNFQGQEAHSWDDIRDHVHTTKGAASAQTYDHLVAQEKTP